MMAFAISKASTWIADDRESQTLNWLKAILLERFGHDFSLQPMGQVLRLRLAGEEGWVDFDTLLHAFSRNSSDMPCAVWDAEAEGWNSVLDSPLSAPGVAQLPVPLIEERVGGYVVHYDILGLAYWMLSRLEEVGRADLDEHNRFPATSSHAFKHGYLERPVVDEWLHVLGQVILRQWPGMELKRHQFSMKVSHDVDNPSRSAFLSIWQLLRMMAGDIVSRRDLGSAYAAVKHRMASSERLHPDDPMNTFDWLMDVSERHGLQSAFYFICGRTNPAKDARYEIEHPLIRDLLRRIHERGHEIGLHPSYGTCQLPDSIVAEADRLHRVCSKEGIRQDEWGGRMHYLRWAHPITMRGWERAEMAYDTTLGYADRPGFRCGTCFEYPALDPVSGEALRLRVRPLIAMECTVMAERYLGLGNGSDALQKFIGLKKSCKAVDGCFTLLWHNSYFPSIAEQELYTGVLECQCR